MSDDLLKKAEALCVKTYRGGQTSSVRNRIFAKRYVALCDFVPELMAEVKRLRKEMRQLLRVIAEHEDKLATKDNRIQQLRETLENLRQYGLDRDAEITRWQAIAIEERAKYHSIFDQSRGVCHFGGKDAYKELSISIDQKASYISRLESDYLSWVYEYYRDLGEERAIAEAQAALDKIREG